MGMNLKELCRLCAKEDEFTKDLLHESNHNLLKLIKEFVHIVVSMPSMTAHLCQFRIKLSNFLTIDLNIHSLLLLKVNDNDDLPTKICLNCEEKMIDFQLFVLECCKVQNTLKDMCGSLSIKVEGVDDIEVSQIKSEVCNKLTWFLNG